MLGVVVHRLQVVERGGRVAQLADALVVFALAASHAAEVEAQNSETHIVKGVVKVVDNLVVHRPAELRVRVQNDRDRCVSVLLGVVAAFKTAFGSGKNDLGHRCNLLLNGSRA